MKPSEPKAAEERMEGGPFWPAQTANAMRFIRNRSLERDQKTDSGGLWAEAEAETVPCLLERKQVWSLAENHGHSKA